MKQSFQLWRTEELSIRGDVFVAREADRAGRYPVIVICHGFKGFKDWGMFPRIGDYLAAHGFVAITFNFSGNGVGDDPETFGGLAKFGRNTYRQELDDLAFLIAAIKAGELPLASYMDTERIGLMGHSKGGGDTILYAASHPGQLAALSTWNGISHVDVFGADVRRQIAEGGTGYIMNGRTKQNMPIEKVVLDDIDQNAAAYDIPARAAEIATPLLIVQGRADFARLVKGAPVIAERAQNAVLHWIEDAGHTFNTVHPYQGDTPELQEALEVTTEFFTKHLM
ncbi:dienelactone hydrolase family protein [Aneurinibacillus soli]|uniref:Alpha/beta hydrolase family protein n=1 Tax=Aneurinibacillus soli TaxID=1500254 RepID=A0A0U5AWM9_9BACL|nr:alpha/beta fold hydrolase [Aneurinibacillus soli]PYE58761.1 dienelactone hydrolase family protein [Aneurinibacillus soli]BAU26626.1 Alpha/beta hydrolase family protein [Aneurinibacillus soli]